MIYFSSDHHFGHTGVIEHCKRPFSSKEEMNETLIKNWNDTVKPSDDIFYMGDFSLNKKSVVEITPRLNGNKYLIPGNHDLCHTHNPKSRDLEKSKKMIRLYEEHGWKVFDEQLIWSFGQQKDKDGPFENEVFCLCHFPYCGDPSRDFSQWLPKDEGRWQLHGHVHTKWKVRNKMINVGCDVWDFKPVSLDQIMDIIFFRI